MLICCSKFELYLAINRWVYDPDRGLSIDTQNPQKARSLNATAAPKRKFNPVGEATGARFGDEGNLRSARNLGKHPQGMLSATCMYNVCV